MPRIALVTCLNRPEPDPDETLLLDACLAGGLAAEYAAWDDDTVNWSVYDLAVLRSTWDYYNYPDRFANWVSRCSAATSLWNPPQIVTANIHKSYLFDLERQGVPIVPSRLIRRGSGATVREAVEAAGWERFVVKPAISASSHKTGRFDQDDIDQAEALLAEILDDRDAVVQQYLPRVAEGGEAAFIHVAGELTHGVIKRPRFDGGDECVSDAIQPTAEQREVATMATNAIAGPWLYARVDLMLAENGAWLLSELELIEPSLYFLQFPPALDLFVNNLKRVLAALPRSNYKTVTSRQLPDR